MAEKRQQEIFEFLGKRRCPGGVQLRGFSERKKSMEGRREQLKQTFDQLLTEAAQVLGTLDQMERILQDAPHYSVIEQRPINWSGG